MPTSTPHFPRPEIWSGNTRFFAVCAGLVSALAWGNSADAQTQISVDAAVVRGPVTSFWGGLGGDLIYDYATETSNQQLWQMVRTQNGMNRHKLFTTWRCHNVLSDYESVAATNVYDEQRNPVYDYSRIDEVFDNFEGLGMIPIVELGFMPEDLAEDPNWIGDWNNAIISPPADYAAWRTLVTNVTQHLCERYPQSVDQWWWEIWNEPNIDHFWQTDQQGQERYYELYDWATDGIKNYNSQLEVGGPASAGYWWYSGWFIGHVGYTHFDGRWGPTQWSDFPHDPTLNYTTGGQGSPVDFFSHHSYGRIRKQLSSVYWHRTGIRRFYPTDPDSKALLLDETAAATWAKYWQTTRYSAVWRLAQVDAFYELSDYWNDTNYIPDVIIYWGGVTDNFGHRSVATKVGGQPSWVVKLPLYNAYEMLSMLGTERVATSGVGFPTDFFNIPDTNIASDLPISQINALATRVPGESVQVIIYHLDETDRIASDVDGSYINGGTTPTMNVRLTVHNIPFADAIVSQYEINRHASNSYGYWRDQLGGASPGGLSQSQYQQLADNGDLTRTDHRTVAISGGNYQADLVLQEQSAIFIEIARTDPIAASPAIRVNCGGTAGVDHTGEDWAADRAFVSGAWGYSGGSAATRQGSASTTTDPFLYESERYGQHSYRFAVDNGDYAVDLHFFENYSAITSPGQRVFDVRIEGSLVLDDLDIFGTVGFAQPLLRSFVTHVADGDLTIDFESVVENPRISAIAIEPISQQDGQPFGTDGGPSFHNGDSDDMRNDRAVLGGCGCVGTDTSNRGSRRLLGGLLLIAIYCRSRVPRRRRGTRNRGSS